MDIGPLFNGTLSADNYKAWQSPEIVYLGKNSTIVPLPPDPLLVPQSIHGNFPMPIAPPDSPGFFIVGDERVSAFKFTWRHYAFFWGVMATVGEALLIVYGSPH